MSLLADPDAAVPAGTRPAGGPAADPAGVRRVALIGNPNTGKTTVFNALTGGWAPTGNYPGVTVEKKVGTLRGAGRPEVHVLDLPGTYSLAARSPDERVAVDVLLGRREDTPRPEAVVVVVDASNLERNLYLLTQILETGLPTVVALNMTDTAERRGIRVDPAALAAGLGVPVIPTVAHRRAGIDVLVAAVRAVLDAPGPPAPPPLPWPPAMGAAERLLEGDLSAAGVGGIPAPDRRRALLDRGGEAERSLVRAGGPPAAAALERARAALGADGASPAALESAVRYRWIADLVRSSVAQTAPPPEAVSDRIDRVLLHRGVGTVILVLVLGGMFLAVFAGAAPLMDLVDRGIARIADAVRGLDVLGDGALRSLAADGLVGGVGSVLVFLPQILLLFAFVGLLEGCGYMARAAVLADRWLRPLGLSGRSFIPMLTSFACTVPGILAARTIENRRDRIVTILVAPFMSCSARIPVYVVLIAAFVPARTLLGFVPLQGLVFVGLYLVGIAAAVPLAFLLKRTLRGDRPSFLVELPPYRVPDPAVVLRRMLQQGREFVLRAGTLIAAAAVVVWALSYFPRGEAGEPAVRAAVERHDAQAARARERLAVEQGRQEQAVLAAEGQSEELGRVARRAYEAFLADRAAQEAAFAATREDLLSAAEREEEGERLRQSWLGRAGRFVEPVFAPIGWDWKVAVAVLASFPARELLVSSLGVLYNVGSDVEAESEGLRERLRGAAWESGPRRGEKVFTLGSALALMVFFALCAQCFSTLVTIRKETGTWRWAAFSFAVMTAMAWVGALATSTLVGWLLP